MFTKIEPPGLLRKIVDQVKQNIASGNLKKGDKLPSERQMSEMFGLSRATIREAIKALNTLGIIECSHGSGNYISSNLSNSLTEPLSIMFMLEGGHPGHTLELRRAIEFAAAGSAARNIEETELARLRALCDCIEASTDENEKARYDFQFHREIARASGNPLLIVLLNAVETLISEHVHDARASILKDSSKEDIINRQHRDIVDALSRSSPEEAEKAVLAHIELIRENMTGYVNRQ
ncbi:MAG: FadR/GntR family transcriptional regulator [Bacillota bacterium]|jgi:GntR family transcriptional repressor for pyruvate dehydrogenase complex|nr:FadR family transcriptional regulator [Candidatus Fermentithermobacillaceae bacterium]HPZ85930.1 FadR/GntR family transcriptional regulator [Bacillota bacterium]